MRVDLVYYNNIKPILNLILMLIYYISVD